MRLVGLGGGADHINVCKYIYICIYVLCIYIYISMYVLYMYVCIYMLVNIHIIYST